MKVDLLHAEAAGDLSAGVSGKHHVVVTSDMIEELEENTLRGHGTIARRGELIATTCGVVERTNKLICVRPVVQSRYAAEVGDVVVGRITALDGSKWVVDLQSKGMPQLQLSAVNLPGDVQRRRTMQDALSMRSILAEDDLLSAEIQAVHSDGVVLLHTRSQRYGKLCNGEVVRVSAGLVKRQRQHIVEILGMEVILGCNGYIWVGLNGGNKEVVDVDAESHATIAKVASAIRRLARAKKFVTFDSISEALAL
mmetsp:Transcript_1980/g.6447  ORF Transcript_1980/g.6447 Transcript_1980/m.6447 type:complete len:253 (+) Transcript_1980:128-886(+)